jgi:hypothetical protein
VYYCAHVGISLQKDPGRLSQRNLDDSGKAHRVLGVDENILGGKQLDRGEMTFVNTGFRGSVAPRHAQQMSPAFGHPVGHSHLSIPTIFTALPRGYT